MVRLTAALVVLLAVLGVVRPASATGPWRQLHRQLRLPRLAPGGKCPISPIDRRVSWQRINIFGGSGTGRGPVYPGLGGSGGRFTATRRSARPWFSGKLFWYVTPSYRGPVLIRGHRLDGPQSLRFNGGKHPRELRIRRNATVSWNGQPPGSRGVPSILRIHAAGCYGVQIDGTNFSRSVIFPASTP